MSGGRGLHDGEVVVDGRGVSMRRCVWWEGFA